MDLFPISYTLIKSEATNKGLKYFYTTLLQADGVTVAGYNLYALSPSYGLSVTITQPADITDFQTNIQPTATVVNDQPTAQGLASLAQLQAYTLPGSSSGRSYGYTGTSAVTVKAVRATVYTPPGNNAQRSIVSTSVNDAAAGSGARTVKITYFDATGAGPFTETLTLNGTTAVNTVGTNIAFIERIDVLTVGAGGSNAGTINLQTLINGGGTTIGSIAAGDNQTNWAHHYVPVGKTCYVILIEGSASVVAGALSINSLNPINAVVAQVQPDMTIRHGTTHISSPCPVMIPVVGPALIVLNEKPDAVTASTTFAGFYWIQQ